MFERMSPDAFVGAYLLGWVPLKGALTLFVLR